MHKIVLLLLLSVLIFSGCRTQDFTSVKLLRDFAVLDNGNVEIAWVEDSGFRTVVLESDNFYPYEGESRIVETILDGYYQMFVYLNEEDYERFTNEVKEKGYE